MGNGPEVASGGVFSGSETLRLAVLGQARGETESVAERVEEVCEGQGRVAKIPCVISCVKCSEIALYNPE